MIKITNTGGKITVTSPYNSLFVDEARRLGGKFQKDQWCFDARDESAVREACYRCYGDDGIRVDQVDVRITAPNGLSAGRAPISIFGRTVARAFGRDSGAKVGDGVVIEAGGFSSGGSAKNWGTRAEAGTTLILRDISAQLVKEYSGDDLVIEVLAERKEVRVDDDRRPLVDLMAEAEQLTEKRARIDARLAIIEAIIRNRVQ